MEGSTPQTAVKEGWLYKAGGATKCKWQVRWFRLDHTSLTYFIKKDDSSAQGTIQLGEVQDVTKLGEYAGRQCCLSLLTTAKGKKVYYLSADTQEALDEWCSLLRSRLKSQPTTPLSDTALLYATAEVFLTEGIRISGNVHYNILSSISQRTSSEKKRLDNFGWFCECPVALATVLNLFSEHGWSVERVYRSTAVSPIDGTLHPAVRVFFSRSASDEADIDEVVDIEEGPFSICQNERPASPPVQSLIPPGVKLLEGADDELVSLMKEFGIPVSLLFQP